MLTKNEVAKKLLEIDAIRLNPENPFLWASGLRSPIYCDNRKTLSYPSLRSAIKITLAQKACELWRFDMVAGVATAGISHGALIADHLNLPFIYVRASAKQHGARNQIEGDKTQGRTCLVVEDLISTGGSSIEAVKVLRDDGLTVAGVISIFTYQLEQASANFSDINCPHISISDYSALLEAGQEINYISATQLASLQEWRHDPVAWSNNRH